MKDIDKPMPGWSYSMMKLVFRFMDLFLNHEKKLESFGINRGDTVVDYGCGPGRYVIHASRIVGLEGRVYAADIHEFAIDDIRKLAGRLKFDNVIPVLIQKYPSSIPDKSVDLIYALDMFHMVRETDPFLEELIRIIKPHGRLVLEDGHQSRQKTKEKIENSHLWKIRAETKNHCVLIPGK